MKLSHAIAVVGPADASDAELAVAEEVGAGLAAVGCVVVTGGLGGVMEAASRGARSRLGSTIGILPGTDPGEANGWVELAIPSGLGQGRNALVVAAARGLVAIGGGYGTLSEVRARAACRQAGRRHRELGRPGRRAGGGRRGGRRADPRSHVVAASRPLRRRGGPLSPDRA